MTGVFRGGIIGTLMGLLAVTTVAAQRADAVRVGEDTVRVGEDTVRVGEDTVGVREDSAVGVKQSTIDSTAVEKTDSAADHPEPAVLRTVADSAVGNWKNDKVYAYANDPSYWRREEETQVRPPNFWLFRLLSSKGFEYFLLILLGSVLLYAIIRIIADNRIRVFYRAPRRAAAVGAAEDDAMEDDLEGKLLHYMQIKDYRQAVRYLYLKTLKLLDEGGLIKYHQESTNHEYWLQLSASPKGAPFRDLTTIYEKVWYGEFPLGDTLFARLHQYFEEFQKTIRA
jgi:Domain of unknown function (DUF4129)